MVSPADGGQFQPEVLAEAKVGHIDPSAFGRADLVHQIIEIEVADGVGGCLAIVQPSTCKAQNPLLCGF
ncbi:MAG: hypothetical protein WAM90_06515 [Rhodanobacter sp.]